MNKEKINTKWSRLIALVVISTLMAELLSGSTPFSRIQQLLPQFLLYGSGAILVREITRRLGLGWKTIILLGFAFGIIIEGLTLQSIFNPHFLGLNIAYGRAIGVNWVWAEYLTGLHAFWSITGPILVCELIYPGDRNEPWVSLPMLRITGLIYCLISIGFHFLFIKISKFNAPPTALIGCALLAIGVITIALKLPRESIYVRNGSSKPAFSFWIMALITAAAGALWLSGIAMIFSHALSLWMAIPVGPLVLVIYFFLVNKWKLMAVRENIDKLAVASGLLCADLILGYTGTTTNKVDHYGQIGLILVTIILLAVLFKKFSRKGPLITV